MPFKLIGLLACISGLIREIALSGACFERFFHFEVKLSDDVTNGTRTVASHRRFGAAMVSMG